MIYRAGQRKISEGDFKALSSAEIEELVKNHVFHINRDGIRIIPKRIGALKLGQRFIRIVPEDPPAWKKYLPVSAAKVWSKQALRQKVSHHRCRRCEIGRTASRRTFAKLLDENGNLIDLAYGLPGSEMRTLRRRLENVGIELFDHGSSHDPTVELLTHNYCICVDAEGWVHILLPELSIGHGPMKPEKAAILVKQMKRDGLKPHYDSMPLPNERRKPRHG